MDSKLPEDNERAAEKSGSLISDHVFVPIDPNWRKKYLITHFLVRFLAYLLDWVLVALILSRFLKWFYEDSGYPSFVLLAVIYLLLFLVYCASFEAAAWRGTIGKQIVGIQVSDENGRPLAFRKSVIRNVLKILVAFSYLLLIPFIIQLIVYPKTKRLFHDHLSPAIIGTLVPGTLGLFVPGTLGKLVSGIRLNQAIITRRKWLFMILAVLIAALPQWCTRDDGGHFGPTPVAVADMITTIACTPLGINLLANDTQIPTKGGTYTATNPDHGRLRINDNDTPDDLTDDTMTYTPDVGYTGPDSFGYTICDAYCQCSSASVSVTVLPPKEAPETSDDMISTPSDTEVAIDLFTNDTSIPSRGGTLTVTMPSHGLVVVDDKGTREDLTDDTMTYSPEIGFNGMDAFGYTVCNTPCACAPAKVTIQVGPPPPVVVDDRVSTALNKPVDIDILWNDTGIPSNDGKLMVTGAAHGKVVINVKGTPDNLTDDTVTYTPNNGFNGTDIFYYTVCDNMDRCADIAMVTVTVGAQPSVRAPEAVADKAETTQGLVLEIPILENDKDIPHFGGKLTVTTPTQGSAIIEDNGTPDIRDDWVVYTSQSEYIGLVTFEYTVCAAPGKCGTATISVMVGPTPRALPVVYEDTASTAGKIPIEIDVLANDVGIPPIGGTLTVINPTHGSLKIANQGTSAIIDDKVTYTANTDFVGVDTFTYVVCSSPGNCSVPAKVTVTVKENKAVKEVAEAVCLEYGRDPKKRIWGISIDSVHLFRMLLKDTPFTTSKNPARPNKDIALLILRVNTRLYIFRNSWGIGSRNSKFSKIERYKLSTLDALAINDTVNGAQVVKPKQYYISATIDIKDNAVTIGNDSIVAYDKDVYKVINDLVTDYNSKGIGIYYTICEVSLFPRDVLDRINENFDQLKPKPDP
jgi:uncharacterized RDD family membrane protein YckC